MWRTTSVNSFPSGPSQTGLWNAAWRTQAPITSLPPATAIRLSASTPLMSTRCAGLMTVWSMVGGAESKTDDRGRTTSTAVLLSILCPPSSVLRMLRFDDIGNRLKAFRLGSGLSAEEIAAKLGISRTALYRFEKGELAKIETLEKLAELLKVSVPTLLGVGVEYIASAVS